MTTLAALTLCPKPDGFEVRAGEGPFAAEAPLVATFTERADAELFVNARLGLPLRRRDPSPPGAHALAMSEDELDPHERAGWDAFANNVPTFGAPVPAAFSEPWRRGWWMHWARRYAEGYLAAAVYGMTEEHDDDENPHPQFSGAWEAWAAGFEDRSAAEGNDDAPSYIGGR